MIERSYVPRMIQRRVSHSPDRSHISRSVKFEVFLIPPTEIQDVGKDVGFHQLSADVASVSTVEKNVIVSHCAALVLRFVVLLPTHVVVVAVCCPRVFLT